jgi:hypothetical protein
VDRDADEAAVVATVRAYLEGLGSGETGDT